MRLLEELLGHEGCGSSFFISGFLVDLVQLAFPAILFSAHLDLLDFILEDLFFLNLRLLQCLLVVLVLPPDGLSQLFVLFEYFLHDFLVFFLPQLVFLVLFLLEFIHILASRLFCHQIFLNILCMHP